MGQWHITHKPVMMAKTLILLLVSKLVHAQVNGEFWWLDKRVSEYQHVMIPQPKFENLSEFDNDESDKIVFRDDNLLDIAKYYSKPVVKVDRNKIKKAYDHFQDENKVVWPNNGIEKDVVTISNDLYKDDSNIEQVKKYQPQNNNEEMSFVFPDTKKYYISKVNTTNSVDTYSPKLVNSTKPSENKLDAVISYNGFINTESERNKEQLDNVRKNIQGENKVVWPSETKKENISRGNISNKYVEKEVKTDKPVPHNSDGGHSFVFPDTEKDKYVLKNNLNSNKEKSFIKAENNSKVTRDELSKTEFSNVINNNREIDEIFVNRNQSSFRNGSKFMWPDDFNKARKAINKNNITIVDKTKQLNRNDTLPQKSEVEYTFVFPDTKQNKLKSMRTSSSEKPFTMQTNPTAVTKNNLDSLIVFDGMKSFDKKNTNKSLGNFQDKNQIAWPDHNKKNKVVNNFPKNNITEAQKNTNAIFITSSTKTTLSQDNSTEASKLSSDKVPDDKLITVLKEEEVQSKTLCTYLKKEDCIRRNGFIYSYEFGKSQKQGPRDPQLICCILPLPVVNNERKVKQDLVDINTENPQIFYSDILPQRHKRSNTETINMSAALKQRDALLRRKYGMQSEVENPHSTETKIVSPDSNEDPYWNIKDPKLESTNKHNSQKHYEYDDDYTHNYHDELPKPGLVGLYSDHGPKPSVWTFGNQEPYGVSDDYSDEDDDDTPSFGYSTIDPRRGPNSKTRKRGKPLKLTTNSEEETYDAESHIINYQSNPDFHVLEGFKILNVVRNKNRVHSQVGRKTTENLDENESKETLVTPPFAISSGNDELIEEDEVFKGCGRSVKSTNNNKGSQIGDAEVGTHPWLILVVQTENLQNIMCYATLIHPRLALTTANCVYGTSDGELTIIAGLWDLNQGAPSRSRVPSIHFHPKYSHGGLAHGLAILKWKRPLRLDGQVQPVCLADAEPDDDCKFFGWGGFGRAIRLRSRWQRATISSCDKLISANKRAELPSNAFCATVSSRGTVTGIGAPLVCEVAGRQAAVGVTVSRHNNVLIMLPVGDWALVASDLIGDE